MDGLNMYKKIILVAIFLSLTGCLLGETSISKDDSSSTAPALPACTTNGTGNCKISQATVVELETNLIAGNIANGITIFGVLGSYTGSGGGTGALASNMYRDRVTPQLSMLTESTTNAGVQYSNNDPGYRAIPRIGKDDDGYIGGSVTYVDRSTWAASTCGTVQATLDARIADCATVFGANATWDGAFKGNAGQGVWKLVTRTGDKEGVSNRAREVWRDERTGLLWSSLVSGGDRNANWCKASGSNNIAGNPASEDDPNNYCDQQGPATYLANNGSAGSYQNTSGLAISACFEDGGINFTDVDADLDPAGKAGLGIASTPAVSWRLPTKYDQQQADNDGIRFVVEEMSRNFEWSASVGSVMRYDAWFFNSYNGAFSSGNRYDVFAVRCVGR
jgi:hypothetical protein